MTGLYHHSDLTVLPVIWGRHLVFSSDGSATGQVEEDALSGSLHRSGWHLVVPFDRRIPKIRIKTSQADTLRTQRSAEEGRGKGAGCGDAS